MPLKTKTRLCLISIAIVAFLAGCATNDQGQLVVDPGKVSGVISGVITPPPPPADNVGSESAGGPASGDLKVAREFSEPQSYLGPMPTLILVMKPYDEVRNSATCKEFLQIPALSQLEKSTPSWQILAVRWPTLKGLPNNATCDQALPAYDYFAASQLLQQVQSSATDGNNNHIDTYGAGPFVIEEYATGSGIGFIVMDFSKVTAASGTGLEAAFEGIAKSLAKNIAGQKSELLKGSAAAAAFDASATPGTAAVGWWDKVCLAVESKVGKVILAVFGKLPVTSAVVSWVDTIDSAGCNKSAADGKAADSTPAASAVKSTKAKHG